MKKLYFSSFCLFLATLSGVAADRTWTGATDGSWGVGTNWSGNTAPLNNSADNVIFYAPAAGNLSTTVGTTLALTGTLFFNSNADSNVTIDLAAGLRLGGFSIAAGSDGSHSITTGNGSNLTVGNNNLASDTVADYALANNSTHTFTIDPNIGGATQTAPGSNVTRNYNFGGSGNIVVNGSITLAAASATNEVINVIKTGNSTLSLLGAGSSNGYNGRTEIDGGSLEATKIVSGGAASSIGISSAAAANLVINTGTLRYIGSASSSNRLFTLGATGALETSGSGQLTLNGTGTMAFVNANTASALTLSGTGAGSIGGSLLLANNGSGTLSLIKNGSGSWTLSGANTYSGGTTINSGTMLIGNAGALGTGNLVLNGGALNLGNFNVTTGTLTLAGGSVVSGTLNASAYFGQSGTVGAVLAGPGIGLTKSGSGTLTLAGANTYTGTTSVTVGTLVVNGSGASSVTVSGGAILTGSGTLGGSVAISSGATLAGTLHGGAISGAGTVAPGNSPGIATFTSADLGAGMGCKFEFASLGAPAWNAGSGNSGNDVLRLTDGTSPIAGSASSGNIFDIYFATLADGSYLGGFFTDKNSDFASLLSGATYNYWVVNDGNGGLNFYNGHFYDAVDSSRVIVSTEQVASANFVGGTVSNGWSQEFTVVPEPQAWALAGGGLALLLHARRKRWPCPGVADRGSR